MLCISCLNDTMVAAVTKKGLPYLKCPACGTKLVTNSFQANILYSFLSELMKEIGPDKLRNIVALTQQQLRQKGNEVPGFHRKGEQVYEEKKKESLNLGIKLKGE